MKNLLNHQMKKMSLKMKLARKINQHLKFLQNKTYKWKKWLKNKRKSIRK